MVDGVVGAVNVKPLVWDVTGWQSGDGIKGENDDTWSASAHGFQYCAYFIDWHGGANFRLTDPDDNRTSHPSLAAAKAAAQADYEARIMAALDVQPMDVKISLDTSHVRAMLDDAEKSFSHLTTIAATITVNALRHGATHAQIMDFITGKSDFVNWLRDQVKPKPITVQDAAVSDVLAERARQISAEGWTPEHDDAHEAGELARAAACYAMQAALDNIGTPGLADATRHMVREMWPWSREWWKPADHRRDLVKAGAMILAEIQRLDRAALRAIAEGRE